MRIKSWIIGLIAQYQFSNQMSNVHPPGGPTFSGHQSSHPPSSCLISCQNSGKGTFLSWQVSVQSPMVTLKWCHHLNTAGRTDVSLKARSGRRPSASNRSTLSPSYYSAVQINVVKGCVNKKRAYATFDHVFWTAE